MDKERNKMNKRSKKAQFFIIGAVILGIIILSIAAVWNVSLKGKDIAQKKFQTLCQNYKNEVFEISKHAVISGNKSGEGDAIFNFTMEFMKYINITEPNFNLIYVYGDKNNITVYSYNNQLITDPPVSLEPIIVNNYIIGYMGYNDTVADEMNISNEKINKSYKFYEDERFYFIAFEEKEGEFYVCE